MALLREEMVQRQLIDRGIRDERVLAALRKVPRHRFVLPEYVYDAYDDGPLPIGACQTISQPYIVALMTELLHLQGPERVLEVGTGSGYQTAILAELAREVYTVELEADLLERARQVLTAMGYNNIYFRNDDGSAGWPEAAPFDAIIVTAAPPEVPPALIEQLRVGGRLVIPVGSWDQDLRLIVKYGPEPTDSTVQSITPVRFVPLRTRRYEGA
ncbi:MAG: protein-L-isoaspartate(D-aspartate) O-methyltransferase [Acidobacteria bacterium]|nr:protein-L-isoaspartate(D-aspartate) O-methyltransferase [Acidobacteriota bacterium]